MNDILTRFDESISSLETILEAAKDPPLVGLQEQREQIAAEMGRLMRARGALSEPLIVLLLGGTGVGKSALINALAGAEIARSSIQRPTTDRITVYMHEEAAVSRLKELDPLLTSVAHHRREELREKVLIDAPDFDSIVRENRRLLVKVLEEAEFVLVVVDREKYLNRSLYELVRPHRAGRGFGFVFNKIDHGLYRDEILDDFRAFIANEGFEDEPVFALSALKAGEDPERWGIAKLGNFLGEELDRARIQRMKLLALEEILRSLLDVLRERLSPELAQELERWRQEARQGVENLEGECLAIFESLLTDTGPLAVVLSTYLRGVVPGPVGFGVRLVERVSGWAGTSVPAGDVDALKLELRAAAEHVDPSLLSTRLEHLHREVVRRGGRAGLSEEWLEKQLPERQSGTLSRELMRSVAGDLLEVFEQTVGECRAKGSSKRLILLNLPIILAGVFMLAELFRNIFGLGTGIGYLLVSLTVLVISAIPGIYVGLLWVNHKRNRSIQLAKGRIRAAARRALDPGVLQPVQAAAESVERLIAEVDGVEKVVDELGRERTRGRRKNRVG